MAGKSIFIIARFEESVPYVPVGAIFPQLHMLVKNIVIGIWAALDRKEGVAVGAYERKKVEILTLDDETVPVLTYSVVHKEGPFAPTSKYMSLIIGGARYWSLPGQYVDSLVQTLGQLIAGPTLARGPVDPPLSSRPL